MTEQSQGHASSTGAAGGTSPHVTRRLTYREQMWGLVRATTIVFAMVVAAEIAARVEDLIVYGTPLFSRVTSIEDLVVRDAQGMHGRPSVSYQKWHMNSLGLRGPEVSKAPDGAFRIVTVGASETFGLLESPGKEYPRQLEDSLRARISRSSCPAINAKRVEVLNAAFAGMSLPTIDQDVRLRLQRLRPDAIIIYPAAAGYLEDPLPRAARPDSTHAYRSFPVSRALHPRLFSRVRAQVKQTMPEKLLTVIRRIQTERAVQAQRMGWRFARLPADRLDVFSEDLRHLVGTIQRIGAKPVLVTHANVFVGRAQVDEGMLQAWEKFYPRATGATIVAFDSASRAVTMRVASDSGVLVVDASRRLAEEPPSAFGDFVHFTDSGAAAMADVLADSLCADMVPDRP